MNCDLSRSNPMNEPISQVGQATVDDDSSIYMCYSAPTIYCQSAIYITCAMTPMNGHTAAVGFLHVNFSV